MFNCGKDLQNKEKCKNEEEIETLFEKYKNNQKFKEYHISILLF